MKRKDLLEELMTLHEVAWYMLEHRIELDWVSLAEVFIDKGIPGDLNVYMPALKELLI